MLTRRNAIKTTFLACLGIAAGGIASEAADKKKKGSAPSSEATPAAAGVAATAAPYVGNTKYPYVLPPLGYAFDALEPSIDARTMEIHHDKHHAAYVANLNKALADVPAEWQAKTLDELLTQLDTLPESIRTAVRNNAGGHSNHSFFWKLLKSNKGGRPKGDLAKAIDTTFGSYDEFQKKLAEAATKVFGSGWAWLVVGKDKALSIVSTPNQDTPISQGLTPILGLDVWEHAYYLKYQNRRPEYIAAFGDIINWDHVDGLYQAVLKK